MDTTVASRFVNLALEYEWGKVKKLSDDEVQVLFATVSAAGFEPKVVIPGKLMRYHRDGETYPINSLCPFRVVSQEDGDHYFATGWLDCALRRVVFGASRNGDDCQKLIKAVELEIERSIPLQPVQLTREGDLLREYPPQPQFSGLEYFVDHTRDDHDLNSCVGIHEYCNGWMDRHRGAKTLDVIVCRSCHLRVLFPKEIKTYGELRQALASKRVPVPT